MNPQRIQRKRIKGYKMPAGAVYVGRPTKWGNPFKVGQEMNKWQKAFIAIQLFPWDQIAEEYRRGTLSQPLTLEKSLEYYQIHIEYQVKKGNLDLSELRGKDLACWCPIVDKKCHADVLLKLANDE